MINKRNSKNKLFLYILMALVSIGLLFAPPNASAQVEATPVIEASTAIVSPPPTIYFNAPDDGELTGDMLVKFDAEPSSYPGNYDYYFDGSDTFQDIKAYVHTPATSSNCPVTGQAIYSVHINSPGIYKIQEYVWAKDCGHDSFFVELKKGDKRIPFRANTTNPPGQHVWVKKAHDRFELNGQHNQWHWKDVCHWNAYVGPKEIATTCYYPLTPGAYKLIYSTRETLTRLAAIRVIKVMPVSIPADVTDQEQFVSNKLEQFVSNDVNLQPTPEKLENLNQVQEQGFTSPQPAEECSEENSGAVDIVGIEGRIDEEINIPVVLQASPTPVSSFGFDLTYDPGILEYQGFELGDLVADFPMVDVNILGNETLRAGGLVDVESEIPAGASGTLLWFKFKIIGGQENECYTLNLKKLKDDIAQLSSTGGCVCIASCHGDLNEDGEITPADALIAFKCYLGSGPCPVCADANQDGEVTPADALCIFEKYLGKPSCLD